MAKPAIQTWAVDRIVASLPDGARTLELGCGSGVATRDLKARGVSIQCADVESWHEPHDDIEHTDGADLTKALPFEDGAFQAIVSLEVFEHLTNPFNAAKELARVLADEGQLFLTMPNFWGIRSRWRFLWRGSVNRSKVDQPFYRTNLREGRCPPHINTLPWPILKFALASHGLQVEDVCGYQKSILGQLLFFPMAAMVWLLTRLSGRNRRRRDVLDETNRWSILFGSHHVYIRARNVGIEAIDAADPPA